MTDFLLELLSEEIPARMQAKARADLARLFTEQLAAAGLSAESVETYATPRRLALIARNLPAETAAVREETKGPRTSAPPQALEGFLRKTGLAREQLTERDGIWFAMVDKPGRPTASVLAEAIPAIVRAFPWPKSMRWGEASLSTESPRWVRPLQGIVALFGEEIVECEAAGIRSGAATVGHRFHHPGIITIGSANDYLEKLRACHVIADPAERRRLILEGARAAAQAAGLALVDDEGLVAENAGLTEWPVPLLGAFDPAFLDVPPEVIQLTMRTNQKYFAVTDAAGNLAPNFVCTANIAASDGGAAIVRGNEKVLAARLSDAKFFWEQDLKIPLEDQADKLSQIVFHEKLGTVADKVERVAKLARWLVEEGIVGGSTPSTATSTPTATTPRHSRESGNPDGAVSTAPRHSRESGNPDGAASTAPRHSRESGNPDGAAAAEAFDANALDFDAVEGEAGEETKLDSRFRGNDEERERLANLAERAARLCKADLVTGMVGEFPELQGVIGGYLARAQGEEPQVADAIRDHYKPVGQGDEVPTAPVTVAVSMADKLDSLICFFGIGERPTGSKDPYALRRAAIGYLDLLVANTLQASIRRCVYSAEKIRSMQRFELAFARDPKVAELSALALEGRMEELEAAVNAANAEFGVKVRADYDVAAVLDVVRGVTGSVKLLQRQILDFFADRLKVQQREAGVRHDLIDAVFALGGEDDLVRLLARVRALQSFVETAEGADLLAGYKRAANILRKEGWGAGEVEKPLSYLPEPGEAALIAALDSAEPRARAAVEAEDFEGAMAALASLRAPVDSFFDKVTVNDPDPAKREARLGLLARMRDAVHAVADFSRIEG